MSGLSVSVRDRLTKICGRLASSHDGERATAASMASRLLVDHGLTWADLVSGIGRDGAETGARFEHTSPEPDHARLAADLIAAAKTWPALLTEWELRFCEGIASVPRLSAKQARTLVDLCDKADRAMGPSWRQRGAAA